MRKRRWEKKLILIHETKINLVNAYYSVRDWQVSRFKLLSQGRNGVLRVSLEIL